ncbi:uncharacterized protein LOC121869424 [Homarus americanus]|uniref:uncharacterized protein LOC121869424 n=1 Tax=Homarus americanus TaxID=6706 RepID=UPI001C466841|nr:uncharacterized protein LOC121869424 [Homarus americanus]XP_042226698.1 uncharacterized protein LOC121869424 [Homarus americanus]
MRVVVVLGLAMVGLWTGSEGQAVIQIPPFVPPFPFPLPNFQIPPFVPPFPLPLPNLPLPVFVAGFPAFVAGIALIMLKGALAVAATVKKEHEEEEPVYYNAYPVHHRRKRAIDQGIGEIEEAEKLLLSAATHLDTDGCVLKLLCHLNNKQVDARTLEETVLLQMFSDNLETMSSYNTTIQEDSEVDQGVCDKMFPNCPLREEELGSLLRQTWGCGSLNH